MTQPTFEEKTEIKEGLISSSHIEMILQIIHEFKATVHKKHVQRITNPQRKRRAEKLKEKQSIYSQTYQKFLYKK